MRKKIPNIDLHHLIAHPSAQKTQYDEPLLPIVQIGNISKRRASDVYEHACSITAWQQLYDQLRAGHFHGELDEFWLDGLQVFREYTSLALHQSCMVWPNALWIGLPVNDTDNGYIGSQAITNDNIAIRQGNKEFELSTPNDYSIMGIVVDLEKLSNYIRLLHKEQQDLLPLLTDNTTLLVNPLQKQQLCNFIQQALLAGETMPNKQDNPTLHKVLQDNILDNLSHLLFSAQPVNNTLSRSRINYQRIVKKAREYIIDNPQQAVTIVDLCRYLNISRRTLQNCFQQVLGINPYMYLKAIRLNAVRRELESTYSQHTTVQDSAMHWGFWHMSQFAADYHALFGELPSQSLSSRGRLTNYW